MATSPAAAAPPAAASATRTPLRHLADVTGRRTPEYLERTLAGVLICFAFVAMVLVVSWPDLTFGVFLPVVMAAGFMLIGMIRAVVLGVAFAAFVVATTVIPGELTSRTLAAAALLLVMLGLALTMQRTWSRLGMPQQNASRLISDLRYRQAVQTRLPALPQGWRADYCVRAAHGQPFCGDIVVGCVNGADERFDVAVVDVSGKGLTAAGRSLLMGGAISGLLGVMAPELVLAAANNYLVRQQWGEGFATATHLSVDLQTGRFSLGSAGHPAVVQYHAGSGRWESLSAASGVVLGVIDELDPSDFPRQTGHLDHGDALLIVSDGVIESRNGDLTQGTDRMMGIADQEIARGWEGAPDRICAAAPAGETDDRTVVILRRV
ncbi:serine/threonine-protein phosphatase [Calidifontibacter sp. DB0510]|uniref:Serine/threonine-protein phosphatase n=1 Tax=Metallococcus carri TaxID=1656884 RepID=A0A967B0P4_9MICO|nr:PP2C family protein-serine/threonine phosphatase [Metallococcus carri]NHN55884.1 serine/threonine-protein phosphatase [Metallococcus carri]NOP38428.1 serine/threonine-protein phosphatase [Calidifontibacter sp. DB2511S]